MSQFTPIRPIPRSGLSAMKDVIFAIFLRELKTRFGSYRLGYLWAVIEPLSFVLIVSWLRSYFNEENVYNIPIYVFFAIGYMGYQLFAKTLSQSCAAVTANKGLFNYRQVKPIDAILARVMLELLVFWMTTIVLLVLFAWYGMSVKVSDPLLILASTGNLVLLAFGAALLVTSSSHYVKEVEKLVPIVTRPLFFVSGVFFSLQDIPQQFHVYLLFNPLLHGVELLRLGFYSAYPGEGLSLTYLSAWAIVTVFIGFSCHRLTRSRLVAS